MNIHSMQARNSYHKSINLQKLSFVIEDATNESNFQPPLFGVTPLPHPV